MRTTLRRSLATTAVAAMSAALLVSTGAPASAFDAGPLLSVVNGNTNGSSGTNFDTVRVAAPAACDPGADRHVTRIVRATATNPADQAMATSWVNRNLYSPSTVGLPGPITATSSNSWQGLASTFGISIVPGNYEFELRCTTQAGAIFEQWSGGVTFSSPTAWTANAIPKVATSTAVVAVPNPASSAETVTLTATVSESNAAAPTGDVEFFRGATSLGTAPVDASGVASKVVGPFSAGTYAVSGVYAGDTTFETSTGNTSLTVTQAPAAGTSTILAVNPVSGPAYQNVTLTGTVSNTTSASVIPVGSCAFLDGAATVGTSPVDASGVCTLTSASFASGAHSFRAVFTPTDSLLFNSSTSNIVAASYIAVGDEQTIIVTVPAGAITIFTPYTPTQPLNMGDMVLAADGSSFSATAPFREVRVTDTRSGNPGWTASLTRADFTGAGGSIPAKYSGFENVAPVYLAGNAIQANDVAVTDIPANDPGYTAGPKPFATTAAGNGTGTVDIIADFVLEGVPTSTQAGLYTATVTFTVA